MPSIDAVTGSLTLRVVYDGLPMVGKTTSVRALAKRVRGTRGFTSPAEADGRTLYFDWLEFAGGEFGGKEILVQVTSVPGQVEYRDRRQYLLDRADAIVFVADTRRSEFEQSLALFGEVMESARQVSPPLGVVFQANKRDSPDSIELDALRTLLAPFGRVSLVDTVATAGDGVGEAFAVATRLALDRTHLLATEGKLLVEALDVRTPSELLAHLQGLEKNAASLFGGNPSEAQHDLGPTAATGPASERTRGETVFTPDARLPVGHIWPPVEGRATVLEAAQSGVVPTRSGAGDWWASTAGWRFHSDREAMFTDVTLARSQLLIWARQHSACAGFLSQDRALLVAEAGGGKHRLWQLVRVLPSLRERFLGELPPAPEFARRLHDAAALLWRARETTAQLGIHLRCSLWTIGESAENAPLFVGLMPNVREGERPELAGRDLLDRELLPIVRTFTMTGQSREVIEYLEAVGGAVAPTLAEMVASLSKRTQARY